MIESMMLSPMTLIDEYDAITTGTMQRAADGFSLLVTNQAFDFPHCSLLKMVNSAWVPICLRKF